MKLKLDSITDKDRMPGGFYPGLLEDLEEFAQSRQKDSRFAHTLGVVQYAQMYALKFGEDPYKAQVAAWFHDNCKEAGAMEHGPAAAELIQQRFGITDEDVINAICWHTTGRAGMSSLECCVKLADLLEPSRDYDDVEKLRDRVLESDDIYASTLLLLKEMKKAIIAQGKDYNPISDEAIEYLEGKMK